MASLIEVKVCHQTGVMLLTEPVVTQFTGGYMHKEASMS